MRMIKKSVSVLLVLTMIVTLFTMIPIQASAETGQRVSYKYRFWDTNQVRECVTFQDNVQPLSSCQNNHSLSGWYYLDKSFEVGDRVTVSDEAHIILTAGYTATFKRGIRVASGKELNLYPNENNDNGKLIANGYDYGAAIGSNDEDDGDESSAGTINIYGGNITAHGTSDAAGIGGGNEASGGTVRIYGGFVTANGGQYAAGIGGGDECSGGDIYVYGGTVKANGGQDGAGIGGGEDGSGGTYNQYGGRVTANGGKAPGTYDGGGAGIGGGEDGNQGTVNIYGGSLSAYCGSFGQGAGIGAGGNSGSGGDVNISGGSVYANGTYGAGIGGCQEGKNGTIRITGGTVKAVSEHAAGIGSGYGRFNDQGGDILIENASVEAIGNGYGAGIGGGSNDNKGGSGKNVTIRKSVVTVGSSFGAGIGGGGPRYGDDGGHGGNITIESSMVFAISKERGAGIGGGCGGDGGTIVIRDSFVEAYGGSSSYDYLEDRASVRKLFKGYTAQIYYKDNDINRDHPIIVNNALAAFAAVYDAKIADLIVALILNGEWGGAGIGGGSSGRGANVQIEGDSTVIASGGREGTVAIGHGYDHSENRTLTLDDHLSVAAGADANHTEKVLKANLVSACQSSRYAVIAPCEHDGASYIGKPAGHTVDSCPYCSLTVDTGTLDPHIFGDDKKCSVCGYQGVEIQFDSGDLNVKMDSIIIGKGDQYTIPVDCPLSYVRQGDNTYLLRYWMLGNEVYLPGETIIVDSDTTLVAVYATGGVEIIRSENGHVDADILVAQPGDMVTLTAVPDEDCRLTAIRVVGGEETVYEKTAQAGSALGPTHQFIMPEGSVGVKVTSIFEKNQHEIQIDTESFTGLGVDVPEVLVNDVPSNVAVLGDIITVAVSTAFSGSSIVWYSIDSSGNQTDNNYRDHCYIVGSNGRATFTMSAMSDIRIKASNEHDHDSTFFTPWGSGTGENTSMPNLEGNYYLTEDITLSSPWYLQSNTGICLNGHKITTSTKMDYMIVVSSTKKLTIYDHDDTGSIDGDGQSGLILLQDSGSLTLNGGTLMNGCGENAAGVFVGDNNNTFTMHGGRITGMHADRDSNYTGGIGGAGVYVYNGKFKMDGGEITGNEDGAGVYAAGYVYNYGAIELSGSPVISGNRVNGSGYDLYLPGGKIKITGALSPSALIGVDIGSHYQKPHVITEGLPGNGSLGNFFVSDNILALGLLNGEAALAGKRTVTFDMNGGSPAREPETAALGCDYVLPENTATKAQYVFSGWKIGDTETVLPAGDTTYISDNVTLHAVWEKAAEYAYIENHVHRWEIKIDEDDASKVTVRCVNGDECNETLPKYAQLQINGGTGVYETTYNGSGVTATVYKQQAGFVNGSYVTEFYDESLVHVSEVTYIDMLGNESSEPPVDAGVYFAQATVSPAVGKGEPATISQVIIINRAQPNITVTGKELLYTGQPQKAVNATDIGEGTFIYRINGGDWTTEPYISDVGEYEIEWYYEGENYANVHSPENPGVVQSRITIEHIHDGVTFEERWSSEADIFPTQSGNWYLTNDITLTGDVTIDNNIKLCLNGKTIDLNGHILTVNSNASLELYAHGEGLITGENKDGSSINIQSNGTLIAHDITFSKLSSTGIDSGAITISGGKFCMDGGSVTDSRGGKGGILISNGSFEITGSPVVRNNTDLDGAVRNVYMKAYTDDLWKCHGLTVKEGLTEKADIGVYAETNVLYQFDNYTINLTFTSGFSANCPNISPSAIFSVDQSYNEKHCIWLDNGEAVIGFHKHSYELLSKTDDSIQIRCIGKGDCETEGKTLTLTITAQDAYYDGEEHPAELITDIPDSLIKADDTQFKYYIYEYRDSNNQILRRYNQETNSYENCAPYEPGTYTAYALLRYEDVSRISVTYSIIDHSHTAGEPVNEDEIAATCTKEGSYDEVVYCTVCGQEMNRRHVTTDIAPHTEQIVHGTPADCEHTGLTDGKKCSVCGETLVEQEIIPIVSHTYGDAEWLWAEDYSTATASVTCTVCGQTEFADATVTDHFTGDSVVYTATAELNEQTYNDTRSISADAIAAVTVGDIVTKYRTFDEALENWVDNSTLTLLSDVTSAGVIVVDCTKTLDLNSFILSRNLSSPTANGNVITNNGNLTILDSSETQTGTISGGKNSSAGGAVLNNGVLTIEGGNFTGNKAQEGGAIANNANAILTMNGGSVTGNTTIQWGGAGILNQGTMTMNAGTIAENYITATGMNGAGIWTNGFLTVNGGTITDNSSRTGNGGGIYYSSGTLNLSGSPVITGNSALGDDNDLFINGDYTLTIADELTGNAKIGVQLNTINSNVFTSGLNGKGDASNFISNDSFYTVSLNSDGEAYLKRSYFAGHSLSLKGDIGVNFYLNLTEQEIANGAKVDFVWTVNGEQKTHSVTLSSADKTSCGYKASCPVAVAEMTYEINATLTIGEAAVETNAYSAVTYANVILTDDSFRTRYIEQTSETKYNQLVTLVQTMLDYGSKAQVRFDRNTDHLANGGTDFFTGEVTIPNGASDMEEYLSDCCLEYVGTSVIYLSETTLRHYYRIVDPSKFTSEIKNGITFDSETVTYGEKNGMIYFDKKDIAASQIDTEYVLSINGHDYHYAALDYSALAYSSDDTPYENSITKQLAAAVYRYNQAANAYFAG